MTNFSYNKETLRVSKHCSPPTAPLTTPTTPQPANQLRLTNGWYTRGHGHHAANTGYALAACLAADCGLRNTALCR